MPVRRPTLVAALVVAAALTACAPPIAGTPSPSGSGTAPAGLARFYDQQLSWGSCRDFAVTDEDRSAFATPAFDCTRLEVPLDYGQPEGRTAQIAVLRQKATGRDRIGSLVFNPGGPGFSGNDLVAGLAPGLAGSELGQRFDLVGFDPRGVGRSTPTLDCLTDADWDAQRADLDVDPSPAGVAQTEQENQDYARMCTERSGGPEVLANVGTRDVVKDLDVLRAALGDAKLSYLGYSYGTRIGSTYAEAFPQNVRALVLDGALDPTQSSIDRSVDQNEGFQKAFDAYAADCATKAGCPLGTDPAKATQLFQAITRPLIDAPLRVRGRELSYTDAVTGTVQALYSQSLWPVLTRALQGVLLHDGATMLAIADSYYGRGRDGTYTNSLEAFSVINCVDEQRITDRAQEAQLIERSNAAAPFGDSGRGVVAALEPCAFWPVPTTADPHVPDVAGLPATLVVSTTGDPATPYQAGVDLAKGLGSTLVTFEGTQHTVALQGNACVDKAVTTYLVDLTTPSGDPRCA